jgi:hypothetical protein
MPRAAGRAVVRLLVALLAGFHGWLLWTHASLGKLLEPEVAARWGLAVAVAAAFCWLSRLGLPLLKGRRALVLWLLVILIHGHAAWTGDAWQAPLAVPQGVVDLIPAGVTAAAALTCLLFLVALGLERDGLRLLPRLTDLPARLAGVPAPVSALRFAPRPPPSF